MRQRPTLELLEPRLLYSADTPSALAGALIGTPDAEHRLLDADGEFATQTAAQEIVFIDARTPDSAELVEDIAAQSGRQVEVVVLDTARNGLEQVTEALAGRENVAALHFIAHGGEGVVQLGNTLITADALERNPGLVEAWSQVLTADADILLYGCDIAANAQGRLLADTLARLTGADVSASDDATGHASLGGDWDLEFQSGLVETEVVFSEQFQSRWLRLLPTYESFTNHTSELEIKSDANHGQTFAHNSGNGTYTVNQISLALRRDAAAAAQTLTVTLRDSWNGTVLGSATISSASLGTSLAFHDLSISNVTLNDNQVYTIRVSTDTTDGKVYTGFNSSGGYAGGNRIDTSGSPLAGEDVAFKIGNNDAPLVDLNGGGAGQNVTVAFTEQTPVLIAPAGTLTDVDSANLSSLTLTLTARPDGDAVESLSLNAAATAAASGAGLTVSYTAATGVLSITGSASVANYQTILRGVQYNNTSDAPTTSSRSVTVVANDGALASLTRTSTVTVAAVNDAPLVDLNDAGAGQNVTVAFTEQTPVLIAPAGTIVDDSPNLSSLTLTLTARPNGNAVESLSLNAAAATAASGAGLTVSYAAGIGRLSITGSASVATYQTILQGVQYNNTSDTPNTSSRSVTVVANDGALASVVRTSTVTVAAVNDAPLVDLNGGGAGQNVTVAFTEQTPVRIAPAGTLTDVDSANLSSLTLTLTARPDGDAVESLSLNAAATAAASGAGLTVSYTAATGVLSITGSASVANYQTILRGVQYNNTSDAPTTSSRSVTVVANDGALASLTRTSTVTVAAVNDAPLVDLNDAGAGQNVTVAFTEQTPVLIAPAGTIVDDSPNLSSLTLTLTARPNGNAVESLSLNAAAATAASGAGLTVSYAAGIGRLSITGSASVATYQTILQGVQYNNTSDTPNTSSRSVTVVANDGALASVVRTSTVTVAAVNDAPLIAGAGGTLVYTEGNAATVIDGTLTLTDVDNTTLASATVTISGGLVSTEDVLSFTSNFGITGTYTAGTGVLALSGSATLAQYRQVLESVRYQNTNTFDPSTAVRTITWVVNDGTANSAGTTSTITLAAVNDAPVNNVPGAQSTNEDTALVFSGGNAISITDDAGANPVQVSLSGTNGVITLSATAGLTFSVGDGTADGTMTFTGTVAAINAALNGLSFMPNAEFSGAASLSITTNDQGNTGTGAPGSDTDTVAITVNPLNDAPVLSAVQLTVSEGGTRVLAPADFSISDPDNGAFTYTVSAVTGGSFEVLSGTWNAAASFTTAQVAAGEVRFVDDGDEVAPAFSITANDGAASSATIAGTVSYTPANDAPVLSAVQLTVSEGGTRVLAPADFSISDPDNGAFTYTVSAVTGGSFEVLSGTWNAAASFTTAQVAAGEVRFVDDGDEVAPAFSITANDGAASSATIAGTVSYTPANDAPVLSAVQLTVSEGGTRVLAPADFSISDPDNGAFTYTVSAVTGGSFEVLSGTWNAAASFTTAQVAAGEVRFVDDGDEVAPAFSITANDGAASSATIAGTVSYTPANDAPVLSAVQLTVSEGGTRVLAPADFSISDPDNGAFTYTVSAVTGGSFEVLSGTWNAAASFTTAQVAAGEVRFVDDGDEVAPAFSITANDGAAASATIAGTVSYTALNDAPVNGVPGAQTGNEDSALVFSTGNGNPISIADVDAGASPVQVVLTGTNGAITLAGIAGLTFSVGDGVADSTMTFTGAAAAINAALNGLSFMPSAGFSGAAALSISIDDQGNTGAGGALSDSDAVAINVLPNVAPTVTASGGTTVFTEGSNFPSTPVVVDGAVTVSDPDSATLAAATISIGAGWEAAEDILGFSSNPATMGNIAGSYNAGTGVLSLTSAGATATLAQWQEALRSVTYTNTSETPSAAARTVSFVVAGQGGTSAASTHQVAVTAMNDAPTVSASGGTTSFTGGGAPVVVDGGLALNDLDNATLGAATVWISGGFQAGQDMLGFSNDPLTMGNITGSYNAASGMLSLSSAGATATLSQWQAALRSVTYGNTSATPIVGARSVSFDVNDGTGYALAAATHAVDVTPAPVIPDPGPPVVPPPVIPPVVFGPPPVTPPLATSPAPTQLAAPSQPAGGAASEEAPIQPVSVDIAERPHDPMEVAATASQSNAAAAPAWRFVAYGTAMQSVELASSDLLGEALRQSDTRSSTVLHLGEKGRSTGEVAVTDDVESLRETLREQDEIQSRGTVALAAGSLSMTLAYLLWLIRGGALVASALSALPAWRILDPLPVLARVSDDEDEEEADDEIEDDTIVSFADESTRARQ